MQECQRKAAKCLTVSNSTCPASKFPILNVVCQFVVFGKTQDGAQYGSHLE